MNMKWMPVVLAIAVLGAGCAPTMEQQRAARLEALQLELASALATWKADAEHGHFGTSADAARALVARYEVIYERWGLRADSLTQAMLAYAVAVAVRVDRKELSADQANSLLEKMRADLDRVRSGLSAKRSGKPAEREAEMTGAWNDYWNKNHQAFQVTTRNPVRCEIASPGVSGKPIVCY